MKKSLLLLFLLFFSIPLFAQNWYSGADITLPVRAGNTAAYSKNGEGFLFVVSGRDNNGIITKKHQRYQMSTNTWTDLPEHPTGVLGSATTILKDSLYTIGGLRNTPGTPTRRVYKYNINENTWTQAALFPFGITDAKAVSYQDSLIYVTGGYNGNTYLYNAIKNTWRSATPILPGGSLSWGAFAIKGNKLVSICGTDAFLSPNYFNTVYVGEIDPNDRSVITWTTATAFPGQTRTFFDAYPWENGIIMTGGSTDNTFETNSDECYLYNVAADTWQQLPSKPTSWLTGNSGSVSVNGEWSLLCASGFATDYLSQTEIFTTAPLATENPMGSVCDWKNFQVSYGKATMVHFCLSENGNVDLSLTDAHGRLVKTQTGIAKITGIHHFPVAHDGLAKGVYYCTLERDSIRTTKKLVVK